MSEAGHDLHHEFPTDAAVLHELKLKNEHFRRLSDRHHDLTRDISRVESGLEAASDDRLEVLKKQRLTLLDEIAAMIAAHRKAA